MNSIFYQKSQVWYNDIWCQCISLCSPSFDLQQDVMHFNYHSEDWYPHV